VEIVGLVEGAGGTGLNLYSITSKGVKLVETYTLQNTGVKGQAYAPLTVSVNPAHNFVYATYAAVSSLQDHSRGIGVPVGSRNADRRPRLGRVIDSSGT
jgi:hypothetical protein